MGERLPNLRRLLATGEVADGVTGVWPTITWPSHTSLITGMRPDQHGILGNRMPKSLGGDYYWSVHLLHVPTLLNCVADHSRTSATVTWPVTVDAPVTWDLPEFFHRRDGGSMDLATISSRATPADLAEQISRDEPSFPQQWMDDRTRTLAAVWLLRHKQPDLLLVHLVDLDSDQHDLGPFNGTSRATLERSDLLLGDMLRALPPDYDVAVVSDHGFEKVDHTINLRPLLDQHDLRGELESLGGIAVTSDPAVAAFLRLEAAGAHDGIGRVVPSAELEQYAPTLAATHPLIVVEPAEGFMFGYGAPPTAATHDRPQASSGDAPEHPPQSFGPPVFTTPVEPGNHGFWPTRPDYGSVFLLAGPGVTHRDLGHIDMLSIKDRLGTALGLSCPIPEASR